LFSTFRLREIATGASEPREPIRTFHNHRDPRWLFADLPDWDRASF